MSKRYLTLKPRVKAKDRAFRGSIQRSYGSKVNKELEELKAYEKLEAWNKLK